MSPTSQATVEDRPALVNRALSGSERERAIERAERLPTIELDEVAVADLELLGVGGYSPLTGFVSEADYRGIVEEMHLTSGAPWSLPITLAVDEARAAGLKEGSEVALIEPGGRLLGLLELAERFRYDKQREAAQVYRTTEEAHPGVAWVLAQGEVLLGGEVWMIDHPSPTPFDHHKLKPTETRAAF